jgi:hypothetical protein
VLNKPFQDGIWALFFSKFLVVSGFLITICQNNHLKFKNLMSDINPSYEGEPIYFNPKPEQFSLPVLFYSIYFEEFIKSTQLDSNSEDELIESDYPQRLLVVSRILEIVTEFITGPCVKNQDIINSQHLNPLVNLTLRNMKDINSIYYRIQKQVLQLFAALLEGRNQESISVIETLIEPNQFIDSMFSHFKKLYLFII